jgi:hypothetical protein
MAVGSPVISEFDFPFDLFRRRRRKKPAKVETDLNDRFCEP